ncbi:uncharacterized protein [Eurosta solidaginis]|uniref:uncharacterized protein n=1 Tax=Eurosta solidaginis TaxID=178769 RepID=UPI0035314602
MSRLFQIFFIAGLAIVLCAAEAQQGSRFLAHQEEANVRPYPSAKNLIPKIPFDETFAVAPEVIADAEKPIEPEDNSESSDLSTEEEDMNERIPDQVYSPPEANDVPTVNESSVEELDLDAAAEQQLQSGRLVFGRRINGHNFGARPAKLIAMSSGSARFTKSIKSARIVKSKVANNVRSARLQESPRRRQFFAAQRQQQRNF